MGGKKLPAGRICSKLIPLRGTVFCRNGQTPLLSQVMVASTKLESGLFVSSTGTNPRKPAVPPLGGLTTDRRASGWLRTLWYLSIRL